MRILHLASFDRWSGAVGPAFMEVEALRSAGHDALFGYVGGYTLEQKLREVPHALPLLRRGHGPGALWKSVQAIRQVIERRGIDVLHAHLSWDHQLAHLARPRGVKLVRTYHAARSVRSYLLRSTDALAVVNRSLAGHPLFGSRTPLFTPPAVDHRCFTPDGPRIDAPRPLLGAIGKLAEGRGFEDVIETTAGISGATLLVVGDGPHRPALEALAHDLGVGPRVMFAGYHEDDLPQHYRAMDVLMFTASGSDEGHRAVSEAMACGVVPLAYPLAGVREIIGELHQQLVVEAASPEALREAVARVLPHAATLRRRCAEQTRRFGFAPTAARLEELYTSR